jgi:hypothetical protein
MITRLLTLTQALDKASGYSRRHLRSGRVASNGRPSLGQHCEPAVKVRSAETLYCARRSSRSDHCCRHNGTGRRWRPHLPGRN